MCFSEKKRSWKEKMADLGQQQHLDGPPTPREEELEYVFVRRDSADAKLRAASLSSSTELVVTPPTSSAPSSPLSVAFGEEESEKNGDGMGDESDDSVELDDMPMVLPFLPALDASTQITTFEGFREAITDAQQLLDSRLLAYSQYQQMVRF